MLLNFFFFLIKNGLKDKQSIYNLRYIKIFVSQDNY